jgi:dipeptidyl aminopeptidase/acylaminoacyl peptidase
VGRGFEIAQRRWRSVMKLRQLAVALGSLTLLIGCGGAPQGQIIPTTEPATVPAVAPSAAPTAAAAARATATPPPTELPAPTSAPAVVAATPAPPATTPLTPDPGLAEALQGFADNALLYTRADRSLMLTDADKQQLWLTSDERFCGRSNTALSQGGVWSADGRYVAIHCQDDSLDPKLFVELFTLNVLDTTTGQLRRVDIGTDVARSIRVDALAAKWAPDGPRLLLAFDRVSRSGDNVQHVYGWSIFDAATGAVRELSAFDADGGLNSNATWSPDGTQMAVFGQRTGESRPAVYLVGADGSAPRELKLDDVASFSGFSGEIAWAPDGRSLFANRRLLSEQNTYAYQLLRVDAQSGAAEVLADDLVGPLEVRWSPDGRWFAFKTYATADRTIAAWSLYRADGSFVRSYSSEPVRSVEDLAWLADGRLAFAVNRVNFGVELVIADADGKEQVVASRPGAVAHTLAVAPDDSLFAIGVANQIVIFDTQGNVRSEIDGTIRGWRPTL